MNAEPTVANSAAFKQHKLLYKQQEQRKRTLLLKIILYIDLLTGQKLVWKYAGRFTIQLCTICT